jgi:hypothetical protein
MSNLADLAASARKHADQCLDPACHQSAAALEGALDAEFTAIKNAEEPPDTTGIATPADAGFVSELHIEKP